MVGALLTPSRERNMDIRRMNFTKAAVLASIVVGTEGLSRVNNLLSRWSGTPFAVQQIPAAPPEAPATRRVMT